MRGIIGAVNARFYAPDANAPGDLISLPGDEVQHLTRVLRLGAGDRVRVFNGRGAEFDGVIETVTRSAVRVVLGDARSAAAESRVAITLAQAVLKGDKMDDVVRDAVMMGVAAIRPIVTTRTEVGIAALERAKRRERWQRIAVSSAKQCGRAVVPPVLAPCAFDEWLAVRHRRADLKVGPYATSALMLVEPGASVEVTPLTELPPEPPAEASIAIGPEGGWTPEEIGLASPACRLISLGGRTLRADAMAVVALAALFTRWQEY